jgi:hypothetical protein
LGRLTTYKDKSKSGQIDTRCATNDRPEFGFDLAINSAQGTGLSIWIRSGRIRLSDSAQMRHRVVTRCFTVYKTNVGRIFF